MRTVHPGSIVQLHYIATLDNGRIVQSTEESGPQSFVIGAGELFPVLEAALLGLRPGAAKNIILAAADAYGPRRDENLLRVPRTLFPADKIISPGRKLSIDFAGGDSRVMRVIAVDDHEVTLDGNHPLAGCELTFALQVVAIEQH